MRRLSIVLLMLALYSSLYGQTYPADFAQQLVANGISNPTAMAFAPDGRIFVAQQGGSLRVIKNNALLATPFVSLTVNSSGERGLIGITLDPDFATNNYVYLYYTVSTGTIHNRISRFTASGDVALGGSEVIVLELDPLSGATNHNGGAMHFGGDGKLYVAIGENANSANAQNLDTYHGKLLRINKDGSAPADNPYPTGSEQRKRVWAYGLRNPYTFSVHPTTGRLLVNDVGQDTWEEINDATTGGKNFGWPTTEGVFSATTYPTLTNPIFAYPHGSGDGKGCAITGGTFFYPTTTNYPAEYTNRYFYQDLCNTWINDIDLSGASPVRYPFATNIPGNSLSITTGIDGNLYYLSRNAGALYRIIYNNATAPSITNQPANVSVAVGQPASFSVSALGSLPLTYQWQKGGIPISGATASTYSIATTAIADNGKYSVVVTNGTGNVTSTEATLTVIANAIPVADIITPIAGTLYVAGTDISFSGTGTDTEDGALQPASMKWYVNFHHDTHKHDQPPIVGVANGTFSIPNTGETSANVWYRLILTVTDANGLVGKDSVDIYPKKSNLSFVTTPAGMQITLDGQPMQTPFSVSSVEGILRTVGAVSPQVVVGVTYQFASWSNGGAQEQIITTPTDDLSLTANFSTNVVNTGPVAEILTPLPSTLYVAGTDINFTGKGTDQEDGALLPAAMRWDVIFHHETHQHGEPPIVGVANGTFTIPNTGETSTNVYYTLILTVTDAQGLVGKDSVKILPRTSNLNFVSSPPGLKITLDGETMQTPFSVLSVEGILRTIGAISPQVVDDVTYEFETWSNGGAQQQTLATPTNDLILTAQFSTVVGVEKTSFDNSVAVFPNPSAQGQVTVRVPSTKAQPVTIRMMDVLSREVSRINEELQVGDNEFVLSYGKLKRGVYSVVVQVKGNNVAKRLLVID